MASERAHPDNPTFRIQWEFRWRRKFVPWISIYQSPYRKAFLWRYGWVKKFCRGCDVLDVPCGMGWGTSLLRACRSLVGVDISPEAIKEAKELYGNIARFVVGDMTSLEFPNASFDIIACLEGIEHISEECGKSFIKEAYRLLRNKGQLFVSSPHCKTAEHSGNEYHVHEYKPEEIKSLIEGHFHIEDTIIKDVHIMQIHYFRAVKNS